MRRCAAATRRTRERACDRHRAVETIRVSLLLLLLLLLLPPSSLADPRTRAGSPKPISSLSVSTTLPPSLPRRPSLSLYRSPSFAASDDNRILSERSRASYLPAHLLLSPREENHTTPSSHRRISAERSRLSPPPSPASPLPASVPCTHVCARARAFVVRRAGGGGGRARRRPTPLPRPAEASRRVDTTAETAVSLSLSLSLGGGGGEGYLFPCYMGALSSA